MKITNLLSRCRVLKHRKLRRFLSFLFVLVPLAIASQVWDVAVSPDSRGVSVTTWIILCFFWSVMMLESIRFRSEIRFWSMFISVIQSLSVIVVIVWRG